jgi:hypothetical protein
MSPSFNKPRRKLYSSILAAFAKLRKATIFVISVRPNGTTRLQLDGFSWNLIFEDFSKICQENSSFIKIRKECRVLYMKTSIHFFITSRSVLLRMGNVADKSCRENRNKHFGFSVTFFENCAVYEITWKSFVKPGRTQMTIWRMRIACWIPKATNTRKGCIILVLSFLSF